MQTFWRSERLTVENWIPQRKTRFEGEKCGRTKGKKAHKGKKDHFPSPWNTELKLEHDRAKEKAAVIQVWDDKGRTMILVILMEEEKKMVQASDVIK